MNQSTKPLIAIKEFPDKKSIFFNLSKLPWQLWIIVLIIASGTVGFTATSMLLKLPKSPQCTRIFWPIASASMRLYCAQLEAEQGTVDSLLKAIALVEALPSNHALRSEINKNVEEWAIVILNIAEEKFQSGQLQEAIIMARQVPSHVQVYSVVEERIEKWRSLWQKGEKTFAEVEEKLRESEWNKAFRLAVKLLSLPNKYWATTQYDETVKKIQLAQEESKKLNNAYRILRRGGIDNWLAAIADAQKISNDSYAYREAQNLVADAKNKLVSYIEGLLEARRWQPLLNVIDRLPQGLFLTEEMDDWKTLTNAGMEAEIGTVESLETAIVSARVINADRPLHRKAQDLINYWQLEIEDVTRLEEAQNLARGGTMNDLNAAIAYAELIPLGNPRYQEVRKKIKAWIMEIQQIEDRPILDQARDIAREGTVVALQKAITKANLIASSRTLYNEAQKNINRWRTSIQQQEDKPILEQAIFLGKSKNYSGAIRAARRIGRGRILFQEAQNKIYQWQQEMKAQKDLQEAYFIAQGGTYQALESAIEVIRKIPNSTQVGSRSRQALNRWSYQLLSIAEDKASKALFQEAINLARIIPAESSCYHGAQTQIGAWQRALKNLTPSNLNSPISPSTSAVSSTDDPVIETNR